jgi:hypothetical protein
MARKKAAPAKAIDSSELVVETCFVEDDHIEEAIAEQRQRFNHSFSLGNGGYRTRAHAMSDDL